MKALHVNHTPSLIAVIFAATLGLPSVSIAQIAGSSTNLGVSVVEATQVATGWSVKKSVLGKSVYNDAGEKIGNVEDLIISPDRNVSYVIIGAGGFIGIGRHDVAVPVSQIRDQGGRIVMAGATLAAVKAMPEFNYSDDSKERTQFIAKAEQDINHARGTLMELEKKTRVAGNEAKKSIDLKIVSLKQDLQTVETKVDAMQRAGAAHWREFEAEVNAATAKMRKSIEDAV